MIEFDKVKVVTKYELLKHLRRKRFYGVLIITILAIVAMIGIYRGADMVGRTQNAIADNMLLNIHGEENFNRFTDAELENLRQPLIPWIEAQGIKDSPDFFAIFVTGMGMLAILGAVLFGGDAISSEFEHKTGYVLFPNPVTRTTLVLGKYLACFIATGVILGIAYLILAGCMIAFYGYIASGILGSLAITLMATCMILSMAFTFSSFMKGSMGATMATLLLIMIVFPIVSVGLSFAGVSPWFMPDRAMDSAASTYDVPFDLVASGMSSTSGMGAMSDLTEASSNPVLGFTTLLAYAAPLFLVSLWLTNRREMI